MDKSSIKISIVAAQFNELIVESLIKSSVETLEKNGYQSDPEIFRVPGAYELPLAAKNVAQKKQPNGIIALGAIVRGATPHFDYIALETASGLTRVSLDFNIPVGFGVLTCDTMEQAIERSSEGSGNKGIESTEAVLGMIEFLEKL
ncbi:MAG: 6,7-dimethyl-8-ribityllumazine synthase [Gammaproteobacteria bacterium]|jgi:6,7-dimethyl-8-ribityllumazine synthase|nr:6,7-dimethyl-8-ribityllumazine synthase [Gammaproteobacteria bacterium]MBQ09783.1 6,7-dimethyl-8-ribityllumazine synthase [Gammaproteobacteria bacterium]MDP6146576.1 6,7-dimethyl-8-ribityllumazine synthase [Gammaproteobacteria bacterium]HJL79689.1 6,7-dimethyl-8-ribityllumazine synthase [Gammaproteobacteria bacterium]HJM08675.1 6,7-dimethyl-8-ribityllumazine synthase [Gammaproteobacteria bacterium]|tara:strand:- start:21171 stop:21608 length:438 start_codon:yes stop_codon:yes gene_type:complete